jgi:peptidoglycan/LPS O-acetylase OafA/YrhL
MRQSQIGERPFVHCIRRLSIAEKLEINSYKGPGFDRIRIIAAIIVVFHHSSIYLIPQIAHDYLFDYSRRLLNFGLFAVTIFFALSGFLVAPSLVRTGDVLTFTVHRALRIMPALAVSVFVAMFVTGPLLTNQPLSVYFGDPQTYRYMKNLIFLVVNTLPGVRMANGELIIVNGALWTLYFEVLCYASLALMSLSGILSRRRGTVAVFAAIYVANALLWYFPSLHQAVPDRMQTFVSLFVYFAAGVCLYRLAGNIPWSAGASATAVVAIVVGLPAGLGVLVMPICLPYLVVYIGLSQALGRAQYKKDYSYGIYIFHAQVLTFMLIMFPASRNFFVMAPLIAVVSLSIAILSWAFIEAPVLGSKKWAAAMVRENLDWIRLSVSGRQRPDIEPAGSAERLKKGVRREGAE